MAGRLRPWLVPMIEREIAAAIKFAENDSVSGQAKNSENFDFGLDTTRLHVKQPKLVQLVKSSDMDKPPSEHFLSDGRSIIRAAFSEQARKKFNKQFRRDLAEVCGAILTIQLFDFVFDFRDSEPSELTLHVLEFKIVGGEGASRFGYPSDILEDRSAQENFVKLRSFLSTGRRSQIHEMGEPSSPIWSQKDGVSNRSSPKSANESPESRFATQYDSNIPRCDPSFALERPSSLMPKGMGNMLGLLQNKSSRLDMPVTEALHAVRLHDGSKLYDATDKKLPLGPVPEELVSKFNSKFDSRANEKFIQASTELELLEYTDSAHVEIRSVPEKANFTNSSQSEDSEKENSQEKVRSRSEETSSKQNVDETIKSVQVDRVALVDLFQTSNPFEGLKRIPRRYVRVSSAQQTILEKEDSWYREEGLQISARIPEYLRGEIATFVSQQTSAVDLRYHNSPSDEDNHIVDESEVDESSCEQSQDPNVDISEIHRDLTGQRYVSPHPLEASLMVPGPDISLPRENSPMDGSQVLPDTIKSPPTTFQENSPLHQVTRCDVSSSVEQQVELGIPDTMGELFPDTDEEPVDMELYEPRHSQKLYSTTRINCQPIQVQHTPKLNEHILDEKHSTKSSPTECSASQYELNNWESSNPRIPATYHHEDTNYTLRGQEPQPAASIEPQIDSPYKGYELNQRPSEDNGVVFAEENASITRTIQDPRSTPTFHACAASQTEDEYVTTTPCCLGRSTSCELRELFSSPSSSAAAHSPRRSPPFDGIYEKSLDTTSLTIHKRPARRAAARVLKEENSSADPKLMAKAVRDAYYARGDRQQPELQECRSFETVPISHPANVVKRFATCNVATVLRGADERRCIEGQSLPSIANSEDPGARLRSTSILSEEPAGPIMLQHPTAQGLDFSSSSEPIDALPGLPSVDPSQSLSTLNVLCDGRVDHYRSLESISQKSSTLRLGSTQMQPKETFFSQFQRVYPDYSGSQDYFTRALVYAEWFQKRPECPDQSLFDDFIRVYSEEYIPYIQGCSSSGNPLITGLKYYHEKVSEPVYKCRFLSQNNLLEALQSLDQDQVCDYRKKFGSNTTGATKMVNVPDENIPQFDQSIELQPEVNQAEHLERKSSWPRTATAAPMLNRERVLSKKKRFFETPSQLYSSGTNYVDVSESTGQLSKRRRTSSWQSTPYKILPSAVTAASSQSVNLTNNLVPVHTPSQPLQTPTTMVSESRSQQSSPILRGDEGSSSSSQADQRSISPDASSTRHAHKSSSYIRLQRPPSHPRSLDTLNRGERVRNLKDGVHRVRTQDYERMSRTHRRKSFNDVIEKIRTRRSGAHSGRSTPSMTEKKRFCTKPKVRELEVPIAK